MSQNSNSPAGEPMSDGEANWTASISSAARRPSPDPNPPPPPPDIPPKSLPRIRDDPPAVLSSISPSPSSHSLPFVPSKSRSVARLSPTTAHSRSLSVLRRRKTPGYLSPLLHCFSHTHRQEFVKDPEEVEATEPRRLAERTRAPEAVKSDEPKRATIAHIEGSESIISTGTRSGQRRRNSDTPPSQFDESNPYHETAALDEDSTNPDPVDSNAPPGKLLEDCLDNQTTREFSSSPGTRAASRAHSCPRIRRGEDIREFSRRISEDERSHHIAQSNSDSASRISSTDGTSDGPALAAKMNNFSNFDSGNLNSNMGRQPPPQAPAQPMNGMNGVAQWPNVGAQSDMNVLWEYIVKLSDMHEQIRAQTQQVASGMQQIDSIRATNGGSGAGASSPHVNGIPNGIPAPSPESAEIARLQNDLLAAQSSIEDLTAHIGTLQGLNTDYENAISHTLDKMRPFAQSHAQALLAQKAHYLNLLDQERSQNLELRLEQSRWQEKAKEVKDMLVETLKCQSESEVGYVRKIARLKADNRSLRRICGVQLMEDSEDDDAAADAAAAAAMAAANQARDNSTRQSPEQERNEAAAPPAPEDEKRT